MHAKLQYEFEKREAETKIASDAELNKQKLVRNGFMGGFAVVLLFAGVFFRQRNKTIREKKRAEEAKQRAEAEKQRSEELLLNILPREVADEIKATGKAKAKAFTMVTVMFTDFKDFTALSEKISAELLVDELHTCFSAFDNILRNYNIEKIKTIGDAYLCASGLPVSNYTHAMDMLHAALQIRNFILERKKEKEAKGEIPFELRIGIHTGPVVAGVVGTKKYGYDIWGDTVNIAARMEQNSEAGKINISGATYELVKDAIPCTYRGRIPAKNIGQIDMYFVDQLAN
jgi:class 3 adenylate cyclase